MIQKVFCFVNIHNMESLKREQNGNTFCLSSKNYVFLLAKEAWLPAAPNVQEIKVFLFIFSNSHAHFVVFIAGWVIEAPSDRWADFVSRVDPIPQISAATSCRHGTNVDPFVNSEKSRMLLQRIQ